MDIGETLEVTRREDWRRWLELNHTTRPEIWLVLHAKASGRPSLPYNESVEEALCFGWIDSIVKKLGPQSRAQRYTPRRPGSPLSEMNRVRMQRLIAEGRMTQAGLDAVGGLSDEPYIVPADILAELRSDPETWRQFETFSESYVRIRVAFVDAARRRPEVFRQRLDYFLKMTKQGKRFGMVQ